MASALHLSAQRPSVTMAVGPQTTRVLMPSTSNSALGKPDGPLHVLADRPADVHFSFESRQSRLSVLSSVAAHVVMVAIAVIVVKYAPERAPLEMPPDDPSDDIVWIAEPGPGGGGGGGGNKTPEPPRKVEAKRKAAWSTLDALIVTVAVVTIVLSALALAWYLVS